MTVGAFADAKAAQAPCIEDALFEMQRHVGVSGFQIIDGAVAWMVSAVSTDGVV